MYKSDKFWIFATVCFAIFTILYAIGNGIFSFVTIFNAILFIISFVNMIIILKKDRDNKNKEKIKNKK